MKKNISIVLLSNESRAPGLFLDQESCQHFIQTNKTEDQDIQYIQLVI